jgi:hypothetical protein
MAQDLGSAILAGIQGVQAGAQQRQQLLMQQQELDLARERAGREQEQLQLNKNVDARAEAEANEQRRTFAKTELAQDADRVFGRGQTLGVIKADGTIDRDALLKGVKAGDEQYTRFLADIMNVNKREEAIGRNNYAPTDFAFTGIDRDALTQGRLVITGSYRDGRPGVLTAQGGSGPDENVVTSTIDEGIDLAITGLQTRVIPNSNFGATSAESRFRTGLNVGTTIAEANKNKPPYYAESGGSGARTVLNAIDASGLPVEASRTFISQLSAIKDPRQKQEFIWKVAKDLGVEAATVETGGEVSSTRLGFDREEPVVAIGGEFVTISRTKTSSAVKGFDARIATKRQQADKLAITDPRRERLEAEISDIATKKANFIRTENQNTWAGYEADAKKVKDALAGSNLTAGTRSYWTARGQDVDKKKQAFIKAGGYTPVQRTTDYQVLERNVISRIRELPPSGVAGAIQSGALRFSEPEVRALRARLTEAGVSGTTGNAIRTASKTLPREEIIATLAVAYAQSNDAGQQQQLMTMIANAGETGSPFLSAVKRRDQELEAASLAMRAREVDASNAATAQRRAESANSVRLANIQALDSALRDGSSMLNPTVDGRPTKGNIDAASNWARMSLPRNEAFIRQMARLDPVAAREYYGVHIGQSSQAAAVIFDELPSAGLFGGAKDVIYDWFGSKPTVDTMATRLQNVRAVTDSDGTVTSFYLVNRGTGRRQGKEITATQMQNIDGGPELFQIFARAALINEDIASGRAAQNARQ